MAERVPFLFLLGTDPSRATTERALNFVKRYAREVIVFDYSDIKQGLHPMLAPMMMFVPLEWFCYYLAIYKDHNPDERRYYGGIVHTRINNNSRTDQSKISVWLLLHYSGII